MLLKVFISCSGNLSKAVGDLLKDWIKGVIQVTDPWIYTDVDRGAVWFNAINDQLQNASIGIICLTQENKNRPWILFEAGAVWKGIAKNRPCTLLVDMEPKDVVDPLAQFNHTLPTPDSMLALVRTVNSRLEKDYALPEKVLETEFHLHWPKFNEGFQEALKNNPMSEKPESRSDNSIMTEVLESVRQQGQILAKLQSAVGADLTPEARAMLGYPGPGGFGSIGAARTPPKLTSMAEMIMQRESKSDDPIEAVLRGIELSKQLDKFGASASKPQ